MLTIIYGGLGSGKTLLLTILGKHSKLPVVSNFSLKFKSEQFSLSKFVNAQYEDCTLLLDEAYVYLESRLSMRKKNRTASYILFQSRKKNVDMILTVQLRSTLDKRFRTLADSLIFCEGVSNGNFCYVKMNANEAYPTRFYLPVKKAEKYFQYFDTNEVIKDESEDNSDLMSNSESKKFVQKIVKDIRKCYGEVHITRDMVKNFYWDNNLTSSTQDIVYTKLRLEESKE